MNPVMRTGPDPWMYRHTDGYYYFMVTVGDRLDLWKSKTMTQIEQGKRTTIWTPPSEGPNSKNLWAPEIHYIGGCWYVYFTANDGGGDETRRIWVLQNESSDPTEGQWQEKGHIHTRVPGLDGTVFEQTGNLYFLYAGYGHFPDYGSAIYIARMSNPWTLESEESLITKPENDWEKQGGMAINEGPVVLKRNGRIFLIFSASTTWSDDYCLGMLTAAEDGDLLDPSSWIKTPHPVFIKSAENEVFAPGHNSFTQSPDGQEDWIVYHAISESNGGASRRSTRMQPFGWNEDGSPGFGAPVAENRPLPVPSGQ
jgi:GH43 family beta-xylosidase